MTNKQHYLNYLHILLVILLSSLLFLTLYNFDNKYTHNAPQAVNGYLIVSEENLAQYPARFLIDNWIYYPNQVLTPAEHNHAQNSYEKKLLSIGDITQFDSDEGKSPYGCGTYVMNLILPEDHATYALYLPEIFSSSKVYLNDKELIHTGNPNKDNYESKTGNHIITFDHEGSQYLTLMISVRNLSHYYGGMVYPPAFGTPNAVNSQVSTHLGVSLSTNTLMFLVAMLVLYFGIKLKHKNALLFTLLCISSIGFTSYALIHSTFVLPTFPWYAIELLCGYVFMLLVVILHNRFCNITGKTNSISTVAVGALCVFVLIYGLNADNLNTTIIQLFSILVFLFKILLAGYLIISSWYSIHKYDENCYPLLYASIFYASACIWDRILPNFEPIYSGWFIEWGSLLLIAAIGYMLWRNIVLNYSYNLAFQEEHKQMSRQLSMQLEYSSQIRQQTEENRRIIHDFRHHLRVLTGMAEKNNQSDLITYLNDIYPNMTSSQIANIHFCENDAVDALLRYYAGAAEEKHIPYRFQLTLHQSIIPDIELCTILGNLLENAIEACEKVPVEKRTLLVTSQEKGNLLFLVIRNSYNGKFHKINNRFISSKPGKTRLGIGLASSKNIIENYGGSIDITPGEDSFQIGMSIPIK